MEYESVAAFILEYKEMDFIKKVIELSRKSLQQYPPKQFEFGNPAVKTGTIPFAATGTGVEVATNVHAAPGTGVPTPDIEVVE